MSDVLIGESFVGSGRNAAHINIVLGDRNGPAGAAWTTALATPSAGHVPFVAILRPSLPVKPLTLLVGKAAPVSDFHGNALWGPAQAGVAAGVADAVHEGAISEEETDSHALIVAVWVNPETDDHDEIYRNNREATRRAIVAARANEPRLDEVLAARNTPSNPFYTPKSEA
ncbi:formaldehyde-activating enzyme [Arthrobacter oryzae]|uniref:formaldehyde-activating enzyme n=1 Tax=Arthrobacter oryzae TaxID=409290 RepID=UPI00273B6A6E|nr:formaldehyde-activating enzyme [Arthrobacter oryzae]WLQ07751.1 formaldehyde-activating enzyme [Arthrobacter oryzae]